MALHNLRNIIMKRIITLAIALIVSVSGSWALPEVKNYGEFISVSWKDVTEAHLHPEATNSRPDEITIVFRKEDLISIESYIYPEGSRVENICSLKLFLKASPGSKVTPSSRYISLSTKEERDFIIQKIMEFSQN